MLILCSRVSIFNALLKAFISPLPTNFLELKLFAMLVQKIIIRSNWISLFVKLFIRNKCHFSLPQIVEQNVVYVTFIFIGDSGDGKPSSQILSCPSLNCVKPNQYFPTKGYPVKTEESFCLFLADIFCFPGPVGGMSRSRWPGHNVSYLHLQRALSGSTSRLLSVVSARVTDIAIVDVAPLVKMFIQIKYIYLKAYRLFIKCNLLVCLTKTPC